MNAKEFCEAAIKSYEEEEGHPVGPVDVTKWGSIGVAMEYLGMISDPELLEYISERAGVGASPLGELLPTDQWNEIVDRFGDMPTMRQIIGALEEQEIVPV